MRVALVVAALSLMTPAMAQDVSGRLPTCLACHGQNGVSAIPTVPSLGAMPVNYVLTQLYLFREKIRVVDPMNAMAEGLTDDDLRALGAIFNKMPAPPPAPGLSAAEQETASALVGQYHCNSCHGPDLGGQQTIPRIAGQHEEYVRAALIGYKNNSRHGYSPAMNEAAQDVKDEEIPLLARYVASFQTPHTD
jgi:cytochrome c553